MRVTIIGAGNMGRAIGTRTVAGGHEVEIVDRDPADARALADELGESATALDPDAPFGGEVVVFALYYPGIKDVVRRGDRGASARGDARGEGVQHHLRSDGRAGRGRRTPARRPDRR